MTSLGFKIGTLLILLLGTLEVIQVIDLGAIFHPERITQWLAQAGPLAPLLFMGLTALAVVISPIPSLPLDMAAGATFGPFLGATYAVLGAEIGAIISFMIGRALGREVLTRWLHFKITFCEGCSDRHLAIFVFLARLLPIFSFDLISYGAGLTNMSIRAFASVTFLGMIPPTLALTYAGSYVTSGQWVTIVLGLTMVIVFLLIPTLANRYPNSRLVTLLRGESPSPISASSPPQSPMIPAPDSPSRCEGCHGPIE